MQFPNVQGKSLSGQKFSLPADFRARYNVVLLCFTQAQQREVNTWLDFLSNLKTRYAQLEVYELPTLPRYPVLFQHRIDTWMRQGIPDPATRSTTVTLYLEQKGFIRSLELPDMSQIFTLLVTPDGRVHGCEAGVYSLEKGQRLESSLASHP